ncbi:MAG TPA: endonuclease/exonuclease/phosphatase family protein [Rectinemataceae bacterium]|nr:endonuclease/exonuclease/phosphatase family protein [Rectinemataceae bacterium]
MRASPQARRRSLATAVLSLLTIAAVAFLVVSAFSGDPKTVLLQAQENPSPGIQAPTIPPPPKPAPPKQDSPKTAPTAEEASGSVGAVAAGSSLRVATWNVRDCAALDAASNSRVALHDYVARSIKAARADIIVLEEIQSDEGKGGDIALLSVALAREGWAMPFVAVVNARGEDDLAVFSRYRIADYGPVLEPAKTDPWPRPGIRASIQTGSGSLDLYGFHFKAMGDEKSEKARRAQAEALSLHLLATYGEGLTSRAIVLAGDFNTANDSDFLAHASTMSALRLADDADKSNDFLDTNYSYRQAEPTFVDSRYSSILDHVLISPVLAAGFDRKKVEVLTPSPGPGRIPTSDHNMVLVEISPPRDN